MTPAQAATLLTVAAAFDNRKPDADSATAWSIALDGYEFTACRDAIVGHYRVTSDWLMPSHVITSVRRARAKAIAEDAALSPPAGLDPDDTASYAAWLVRARADAAAGMPKPPAPPASIRGRDVIAELGTVGLDPDAGQAARAAVAEARTQAAADAAKVRDDREAHDAERTAARDADRRARQEVAS